MDTSKEYILMCEKAVEIQQINLPFDDWVFIWERRSEDRCVKCNMQGTGNYCSACGGDIGEGLTDGYLASELNYDNKLPFEPSVWLPRQDQLQGMIEIDKNRQYSDLWNLWIDFSSFVMNEEIDNAENITDYFTSMEQLWLAFVMKEKYSKTWDGKAWIR